MMLHFGIFLESRCPVNYQSRSCFTLQVFMDRILVFLWHMNSTFRWMIEDRELQEFGANKAISILFQHNTAPVFIYIHLTVHMFLLSVQPDSKSKQIFVLLPENYTFLSLR